jgi:putative transposase
MTIVLFSVVARRSRTFSSVLLEAAKSFRRLKAHKQLPVLRAALLRHQQALLGDQPIASKNLAA